MVALQQCAHKLETVQDVTKEDLLGGANSSVNAAMAAEEEAC